MRALLAEEYERREVAEETRRANMEQLGTDVSDSKSEVASSTVAATNDGGVKARGGHRKRCRIVSSRTHAPRGQGCLRAICRKLDGARGLVCLDARRTQEAAAARMLHKLKEALDYLKGHREDSVPVVKQMLVRARCEEADREAVGSYFTGRLQRCCQNRRRWPPCGFIRSIVGGDDGRPMPGG